MEVPGQRQRTRRFIFEHYHFHRDIRYNGERQRYVCASRVTRDRCPVRLWSFANGQRFRVVGVHNHSRPTVQQREPAIRRLQQQAMVNDTLPNEVVNQIFREMPNVANFISPRAAAQIVHRERRRHRPAIPPNFAALGPMLQRYEGVHRMYQGQVTGADGSIGYIFGENTMLERIGNAEELHIDGTFQSIPQSPRGVQLLIIHLRCMDVGIPALFILYNRKTTIMYTVIWQWIINRVPNIRHNLRAVVADFEAALLRAVRNTMPWARRRGCWFHFARAVTRKWRKLRLPRDGELNVILQLTWGIPLVPAQRLPEAIEVIGRIIQTHELANDRLYIFRRYLERYWQPLAEIVSVYNSPWRTNNVAEAFNRTLLSRIGGEHPPLFRFLSRLWQIIGDAEIKWNRLHGGVDLGRNRRQKQRPRDLYIMNLQNALETRRYSMREFLEGILNRTDVQDDITMAIGRQLYEGDNIGTDGDEPDDALFENLEVPQNVPDVVVNSDDSDSNEESDQSNAEEPISPSHNNAVQDEEEIIEISDDDIEENVPVPEVQQIDDDVAGNLDIDVNNGENLEWIHEVADDIEFHDIPASPDSRGCCLCFINQPQAAFIPCGHKCLCHRCKYAVELTCTTARETNRNYKHPCFICRMESDNIVFIYDT